MKKSLRLKRLVDTQQRLRTLEELELAHRRQALVEAEAARRHVLESVSGDGSTEQAWLVARTDASRKTANRVEAAMSCLADQAARLSERAAICLLIERLHSDAQQQDRAHLEASELADVLERVAGSRDARAGQD